MSRRRSEIVEDPIIELNRRKYLKAPTIDQINEHIAELKVSALQYERFFGFARNTIGRTRNKQRALPTKHWHVVYEKLIPAYGAGFLGDIEDKIRKDAFVHKAVHRAAKPKQDDHHPALNKLRNGTKY